MVDVSPNIVQRGQLTDVTFTVTRTDGTALANKAVYMNGEILGSTDGTGKLTVKLKRSYSNLETIQVSGFDYHGKLAFIDFATEGVIDVTATDKTGSNLQGFWSYARSDRMGWSANSRGDAARLIAREGNNNLLVSKAGTDGVAGYYLYQTVNVTAGQLNSVKLDGTQAVAANLAFSYNSLPLVNTRINFKREGTTTTYSGVSVGLISSAEQHTVYVTPGTYSIYFDGTNEAGENYHLGAAGNDIQVGFSKTFHWSEANTGLLNVTTTFDSHSDLVNRFFMLNGFEVSIGGENSVRLAPGTYSFERFCLAVTETCKTSFYHFS